MSTNCLQGKKLNTPLTSFEKIKVITFFILLVPSIVFLVGVIPAAFLLFGYNMMKRKSEFSYIKVATRNSQIYISIIACVTAVYLSISLIEFFEAREIFQQKEQATQQVINEIESNRESLISKRDQLITQLGGDESDVEYGRLGPIESSYAAISRPDELSRLAQVRMDLMGLSQETLTAQNIVTRARIEKLEYKSDVKELLAILLIAFIYIAALRYLFYSPLKNHSLWVTDHGVFSTKSAVDIKKSASYRIMGRQKASKETSRADEVKKWAELRDSGLISSEEFQAEKQKIMSD